jgi:hypothetical protein
MNALHAIEPRRRGAQIDAQDCRDLRFGIRGQHGISDGAYDLMALGVPGLCLLHRQEKEHDRKRRKKFPHGEALSVRGAG